MSKGAVVEQSDVLQTKRRKLNNGRIEKAGSRIFAPFRTVGLVSPTAVPFTSLPIGKTTFQITTSVGRCLHTYDLRRGLNLVFLTRPQTPEEITATCAWRERVFAAWGGHEGRPSGVWVFQRGKKIRELETPRESSEPIKRIFVFGSWIVGCRANSVEVWKSAIPPPTEQDVQNARAIIEGQGQLVNDDHIKQLILGKKPHEHYTTITPRSSSNGKDSVLSGEICCMPTFLNKVFVGKRDGAVDIWNLSTGKLVYNILPPSSTSGAVSALEPSTALSVLAIAREDGSLILHDVRTDRSILGFNTKFASNSKITSISFRTDGLGAGEDGQEQGIMATTRSGSGEVTFWDLNAGGKVSGVLRGAHSVTSASKAGESGGINKVEFLPGQAVMITSGTDNALNSWIFDANSLSTTPRILHSRCGHAASVTRLSFVPSNSDGSDTGGKWLMSAGRDQSLWGWSLRRDGQSVELSQGSVQKKAKKLGILGNSMEVARTTTLEDLKAPEIISIACSLNRDGGMGGAAGGAGVWTNTTSKKGAADAAETNMTGWESVVTGHRGDKFARTWFWGRKRAGRWSFETGDGTEVMTVAITACGTFALVGAAGGSITMFNLQSGIQRQRFPSALTPVQARKLRLGLAAASQTNTNGQLKYGQGEGKHEKAVTGLMVDSLNRTVISCSLDGKIKFWDFITGYLNDEIDWSPMTAIIASRYHRENDLLALSCDDLSIRVVDTETKKTVRELWGCLGQICDFCFSNDGRWIVAASMDSVIRVWDLPTGHLINALRLERPCTALAFSDTGEFLATAHAKSVGINIWNNRALFTHVPTRPLREDEITLAIAPTSSGESGQGLIDAAFDVSDQEDGDAELPMGNTAVLLEDLNDDMQTLSLVPKSRWQTLLHLDTIRQRNKPVEPPKAPEKAPFFLPSLEKGAPNSSLPSSKDTSQSNQIEPAERSRISKMDRASAMSPFTESLAIATKTEEYTPLITHLSTLSPSAADIEIRSLNRDELVPFVRALIHGLKQRRDFELVQTWMAVFLRVHGEAIGGSGEIEGLRAALEEWRAEQEREGKRLVDLVGFCGGVVGFLRSGR